MLLSAVAYEFSGPESQNRPCIFDCGYLQEMCSCLITIRKPLEEDIDSFSDFDQSSSSHLDQHTEFGRPDETVSLQPEQWADDGELYVSLSHYTVLEFLLSPHIIETPVAYFSLSLELIRSQFASNVLKQALTANPEGVSTDWVHDREVYCLTLACALDMDDIQTKPELQDLFLQYLAPSSLHYTRFGAIQSRIILSIDYSSEYFLKHTAASFKWTAALAQHSQIYTSAATLLNFLLLQRHCPRNASLSIIRRLLSGRNIQDLLETQLCSIFVHEPGESLNGQGPQSCHIEHAGTVREIVQSRQNRPSQAWLVDLINAIEYNTK